MQKPGTVRDDAYQKLGVPDQHGLNYGLRMGFSGKRALIFVIFISIGKFANGSGMRSGSL